MKLAPMRSNREEPARAESSWSSLRSSGGISFDSDEYDFHASLDRTETLADHLTEQLNLNIVDPSDRIVAQHLIGMVNEAGYLTADISRISPDQLGTDLASTSTRVLETLEDV